MTKSGTVLYSLQTGLIISPSLEGAIAIPIVGSEGPESQEPTVTCSRTPLWCGEAALELGASGSQHCLKQRSPVDQIQPRPFAYILSLAPFTVLRQG